MFMKKIIRMAAMLAVAGAALLTSCTKDYSGDIKGLQDRMDAAEKSLTAIQGQINNGAILTAVNKTANGIQVVTTNGTYEITNGAKGDKGDKGETGPQGPQGPQGEVGAAGTPGTVWTIGEDGYWYCDGVKSDYAKGSTVAVVDGKLMIDGEEAGLAQGLTAVYDEENQTLVLYGVEGFEEGYTIGTGVEIGYISVYPYDNDDAVCGHYLNGVHAGWGHYALLNIYNVTEKENTFGPAKGEKVEFTEGKSLNQGENLVIRVSPVNAKIDPAKLSFINSKGEVLEHVVAESVKPYDKLLTTSSETKAGQNGLYVVSVNLEEGADTAAFKAAISAPFKDGQYEWTEPVIFAVKHDKSISGYDVTFEFEDDVVCSDGEDGLHDILINETSIAEIHNRYTACEDETATDHLTELTWLDNVPAVAPILEDSKDGKIKANVAGRLEGEVIGAPEDDRQEMDLLYVVKGEKITIKFVEPTVKAFYVELDSEYALESDPSEINAWNSYEYENVGTRKEVATLQMGSEGYITIKDLNNVAGDIIGFRVYAANLDGTLCDPDGKAFYVYVGEAATNSDITVDINAASYVDATLGIEAPAATTGLLKIADVAPELELKNANGEVKGWTAAKTNDPKDEVFTVKFYDKKKAEITDAAKYASAVYVEVSTDDITKFYDNATYTQTLLTYNDKNGLVQKITANITKVMPTEAELVEFRPKQETEDGSGIFKAYMIPFFDKEASDLAGQQAQYKVAKEPAAVGTKDLNNVFYGLDETYVFTVANAVYNEKTKAFDKPLVIEYTDNSVTGLTYDMTVASDLIDNKTQHAITVEVNYGEISTTKDKDGEKVVKEYKVKADQTLQVIFACWHDAEKYVWKTEVDAKTGKVTKDYTPAPQWTAEAKGDEAEFTAILATSSYNNDFFGDMSVADIMKLGWLILAEDEDGEEIAPELVYEPKKQVNPYFIPSIEDGKILFEQISTQVDAAPVADHKETLKIYVQDAFGHQSAICTEITVKKPTTK